jgi:hypothetical protein
MAEALGVGNRVDFDDLPARDLEAEDHQEPSTRNHDELPRLRSLGPVVRLVHPLGRPPGHGRRTSELRRSARRHGLFAEIETKFM